MTEGVYSKLSGEVVTPDVVDVLCDADFRWFADQATLNDYTVGTPGRSYTLEEAASAVQAMFSDVLDELRPLAQTIVDNLVAAFTRLYAAFTPVRRALRGSRVIRGDHVPVTTRRYGSWVRVTTEPRTITVGRDHKIRRTP